MAGTSTLPSELVEKIAGHTLGEYPILIVNPWRVARRRTDRVRQLALVSRAWLHPCRMWLFSTFSLGSVAIRDRSILQVPRFAFLAAHPHLAAYVTHIDASVEIDISAAEPERDIDELLLITPIIHRVFRNVASLEFSNDEDSRLSVDAMREFINGFKHLRHLDLRINAELYPILGFRAPFCTLPLSSIVLCAYVDSSFLKLFDAIAKSTCADTLQKLDLVCYHNVLEKAGRLPRDWLQFAAWKEIKLAYTIGPLTGANGEASVCIGTHLFLTSLAFEINALQTPAYLLRSLLFAADVPALKNLTVCLYFGSVEMGLVEEVTRTSVIRIPIPPDMGPILTDAMAWGLESLVFEFCYNGSTRNLTIVNWDEFMYLFSVSPGRTKVRYDMQHQNLRLGGLSVTETSG